MVGPPENQREHESRLKELAAQEFLRIPEVQHISP